MARTVNATVYAVRREAFVDAAQRLIQTKGYEQMSIQDVLDELDASRGAFYHYFDSKAALLDAVVDAHGRRTRLAAVGPIVDGSRTLGAPRSSAGCSPGIAAGRSSASSCCWRSCASGCSDGNALVRERFRRSVVVTPHAGPDDDRPQGIDGGQLHRRRYAEHVARVLVSLLLGANEHAGELFTRLSGRARQPRRGRGVR